MPEIDGLRFIAIMSVVALHTLGYWIVQSHRTYTTLTPADHVLQSVVGLGYYGVHLFFVISGFVLAVPFCKHAIAGGPPVSLSRYFWRRLTRLEPPYILSMILFYAFLPFFKHGSWADLWPHLLASLAYVHNIAYGYGSLINNAAWSLEVEIQFYLLVPLITLALRLPLVVRRMAFIGAIGFFSLHSAWLPTGSPKTILQFAQYFLMGILICDAWTLSWNGRPRSALADVPGILSCPLFLWMNLSHPGIWADAVNPWTMAMLFYSALRGTWHARLLGLGLVPIIGGMCYSIYLVHGRAIAFVVHGLLAKCQLFGSLLPDYLTVLLACLPAVLGVSAVFYLLVERPCMDPQWPQKFWKALTTFFVGHSPPASTEIP